MKNLRLKECTKQHLKRYTPKILLIFADFYKKLLKYG